VTKYTTQLQAGLGLVSETKTLLELWKPGMSVPKLYEVALQSGGFPNVTARRLRNIVAECFAPRYLVQQGRPALFLKRLLPNVGASELQQMLLLFTCRANAILGDFIRDVYWQKYAAGYSEISNDDARDFVGRSIDRGRTSKRWSDSTVKRVSTYLTGCAADFGLLADGAKSTRRILPFRIAIRVSAYLAYDLHWSGLGDNALLDHEDWGLFGLSHHDVLDELKRLSLQGLFIVQAAGHTIKISWKFKESETLGDVLTKS
jgi:hypothetical protein